MPIQFAFCAGIKLVFVHCTDSSKGASSHIWKISIYEFFIMVAYQNFIDSSACLFAPGELASQRYPQQGSPNLLGDLPWLTTTTCTKNCCFVAYNKPCKQRNISGKMDDNLFSTDHIVEISDGILIIGIVPSLVWMKFLLM